MDGIEQRLRGVRDIVPARNGDARHGDVLSRRSARGSVRRILPLGAAPSNPSKTNTIFSKNEQPGRWRADYAWPRRIEQGFIGNLLNML
ncbi:hypothetical protein GIY62_26480 [Burkholderia plantarii]|nr:hypothetical protein GIY62_26480 [Burkholderia plantarii]